MKTIGMIGGMSWHSTAQYYEIVNQLVGAELGDNHSALIELSSLDLQVIADLMEANDWDTISQIITEKAKGLQANGADCIAITSNTIHKIADRVAREVNVPFIHIMDGVGAELEKRGVKNVGLLGTKYAMAGDFLQTRLRDKFSIETTVPEGAEAEFVNTSIFEELTFGQTKDETRARFVEIIERLASEGAEAVILGCTEIPLLIKQHDTKVPVVDATLLHAQAIAGFALSI